MFLLDFIQEKKSENWFKRFNLIFSKRDKKILILLVVFSIMISIIEMIGISVIMPFISVASDFNIISTNEYYNKVFVFFDFDTNVQFVVTFGLILILFYIFRSLINIFYFYKLNKFTQGRFHYIALKLFKTYMKLPYKDFTKLNSSVLTNAMINESDNLSAFVTAALFMISEIFVIILIYSLMLYVNYQVTLILTLILFFKALLIVKTVSRKIKNVGIQRADQQKKLYELINENFGNYKLLKFSDNIDEVFNRFGVSSQGYAKSNVHNATLSQVPRLFLEAMGFSLIIGVIVYLISKSGDDISTNLPIVSMFVLALYRLLPSVNRILTSYNQMMFYRKSFDIVHENLLYKSENLGDDKIHFTNEIVLKNLSFHYEENKQVLDNLNMVIKKGSKIAFIGESGSGKSTLVDIIIGLYKPVNGNITVDNIALDNHNIKNWRKKIGYIPQSVYLFDGTVAQNVAFGYKIDEDKINSLLKQANIYEFFQSKNGLNTLVGEGGVMLSGGQKQRIAIARALYTNPEILVLDEATSALDNETEERIMDEIYDISFDKTLIIIAHRLSTISRCEVVYEIKNMGIRQIK